MARLTLVLPDLYPATPSEATRASLPRLPALERWLARARREALGGDAGWRDWLLARHAPGWRAAGPAAVAARALAVPGPGTGPAASPAAPVHWLATPVHFVAGLDTLRLHPAGLLRLEATEQQALASDFARVFAGSGWHLRATGRRELLLGGPPVEARTADPARWLGAEPSEGMPAGPAAGALKRVGAEIEMWLHQHPVNEAREARGELPATALWAWGSTGRAPPGLQPAPQPGLAPGVSATAPAPRLFGEDAFLDGLARVTGAAAPGPADAAAAHGLHGAAPGGVAGRGHDVVVVLGAGELPGPEQIADWESAWFEPALAAHARGDWEALVLACGDALWHARRGLGGALRGLKPAAPWWEPLLAC